MKGVSTRKLNMFSLAMNFAERSTLKINNLNIEIMKLEEEDGDKKEIVGKKKLLKKETKQLARYTKVIDEIDNKYFN